VSGGDKVPVLARVMQRFPLCHRVYLIGYALGMSTMDCLGLIAGFDQSVFTEVAKTTEFQEAKAKILRHREHYLPEARKMLGETVSLMEDVYRVTMARRAREEVLKPAKGRDDFLIREETKLITGDAKAKPYKKKETDGNGHDPENMSMDEAILARGERRANDKAEETGED